MLAQASASVSYSSGWSLSDRKPTSEAISSSRPIRRENIGPKPTAATQYWTKRALTAEALLSARETHHTEMWNLSHAENVKRNVSASNTNR